MRLPCLLAAILTLALGADAGAADRSLDDIVAQAQRSRQVDNSIQRVRMVLVSKTGGERVREFELRIRRDGEVVQSWTRFSQPSDVAGTQLVLVDRPDSADEQLLYLPALKRVTRIAGKARKGSFMGSDFSFEDLEVSAAAQATHTLAQETDRVWIVDSVPAGDSSYGRLRTTIRKSDELPEQIEFFDTAGVAIKVLRITETAKDGDVLLPIRSEMTDLKKGTSTRLEVLEHRLNVPPAEIPAETFTAAFMERNG